MVEKQVVVGFYQGKCYVIGAGGEAGAAGWRGRFAQGAGEEWGTVITN